ncbi:hypothetical protein CAPTEDRAFT_201328 [Capitella teleta]|uniref:G-protein coupled receptors family 1 profile domain-containing protein n=1 Tax=Capitella teleta TaxID=283909 RepID=R7UTE4_CAPTE|nr:hypothetical protein CAPTEDRAFT_201328 [Capitella teleta]|eukprot:ELU09433.1 hypothetical protein CAPTEDRAFT_201328 [Capitella teleta]
MCETAANCSTPDHVISGLFNEFAVTPLVFATVSIVMNLASLVVQSKVQHDSENFFYVIVTELCILVVILDGTNIIRESLLSQIVNEDHVVVICKYSAILVMANISGTGLVVLVLLVNQYIFLHRPLVYSTVFSQRKASALLASSTILLLINLIIVILLWDDDQPCTYYLNLPRWHHGVMTSMMLSPLVISGVLRFSVIILTQSHIRQIVALQINDDSESAGQGAHNEVKRNHRTLASLIFLGISLSAHWIPQIATFLWYIVAPGDFDSSAFYWCSKISLYLRFWFGVWLPPALIFKTRESRNYLMKLFYSLRRPRGVAN